MTSKEVVSTSRRRAMRGSDMAGDKLEIEVGSVKSLAHHLASSAGELDGRSLAAPVVGAGLGPDVGSSV